MNLSDTPLHTWAKVEPVMKPATLLQPHCPWCDQALKRFTFGYADTCFCGWWDNARRFYRTKEADGKT